MLECWGAQGGNGCTGNSYKGGAGGYSKGTLTLAKTETLYIYVGGQGVSAAASGNGNIREGGFNGGGSGRDWGSTGHGGGGGGGASDIRIITDSFYARVIVAGAGGGASDNGAGGAGGGTSGISSSSSAGTATGGSGFGQAAASSCTSYECGGGGGGWYGGYGGSSENYSGGGGSGYVYTSSSASNYPSGCLLNSSYYLTDAQTIAGNQTFKSPTNTNETGHSGNGYCRITCYVPKKTYFCKVGNTIKQSPVVITKANNKLFDTGAAVMNLNYTGTSQNVVLPAGTYKFECWGAQGGYRSSSTYGGKGGYSVGTITLTQTTNLFVYVGGSGNSATAYTNNIYAGGFNGGGYRYGYKGGGGATDIRIGKDDLYARIIVAGGGGSDGASNKTGMYGGGLEGGTTTESCGSGGYGGTQTGNTWLTTTRTTSATSTSNCYAGFGFGGNGCYSSSGYAGAGGGGWYGGSGSYPDGSGDDDRGGGGGSGYVYTAKTAANYPSGNYVNSSYYLTDASTVAGNQSFTAPDGSTETGHSGDGFCRITRIKNATVYVKQNNVWIKS
ncbi:MAG: glycine rich protein [Bacteriophage sp.]|nr:MAG: glycine rich protein [Bacteriophage sp.]